MWIGVVTQNGKGGPWKFATTGDEVIQPMWRSDQPNAGGNEIWTYFGNSVGGSNWCDEGPTYNFRFICEYNIVDFSAIKVRTKYFTFQIFYFSKVRQRYTYRCSKQFK